MTSILPNVHYGSPGKPLDWRLGKHVEVPDDDQTRPMDKSERALLRTDPFQLFGHHDGKPEHFVNNERGSILTRASNREEYLDGGAKYRKALRLQIDAALRANDTNLALRLQKKLVTMGGRLGKIPGHEKAAEEKTSGTHYEQYAWLKEQLLDRGITVRESVNRFQIGKKTYGNRVDASIAMLKACKAAGITVPKWVEQRPSNMDTDYLF